VTSPTPAAPPTSAAAVAEHMSWTDSPTTSSPGSRAPSPPSTRSCAGWPPPRPAEQAQGALLLAARLWRRRNSPEGVATFTSDGAVYVQRNDPDVAQYLGIGSYAPPVVG
jgi:hypothetical protein